MQLKIDNTKTYAIALEGGGAKGGYEIGAWKALNEAGIKYNAVSGTSVGALNGGLFAMRDYEAAERAWENITMSNVIELDPDDEAELRKVIDGEITLSDLHDFLPSALELIRNRGLDVAPLRQWMHDVIDAAKIKTSDVQLYACTLSITDRKGLEVHINSLPENEICDMLLASAYHPTFRLEKLGGKLYTDGGFIDSLPLHVLCENGYRDIIAIRIPGIGRERRFRLPDDLNMTVISTTKDLGNVLNFDSEQSRMDMKIGYLDAMRTLYGLHGREYYIDKTLTEHEAMLWLEQRFAKGLPLRTFYEEQLPKTARRLGASDGDYYSIMLAALEYAAAEKGIDSLRILTDRELIGLVGDRSAVP